MSQYGVMPLRGKEKPQTIHYHIQLIERHQSYGRTLGPADYRWAFNLVKKQTVIHTFSFKAADQKHETSYDKYTGKTLLSIPQNEADQQGLFDQVTKLQDKIPQLLSTAPYSSLNPHVAFYIKLKEKLSSMEIPMKETSEGQELGRSGVGLIATMEETDPLVRKPKKSRTRAAPVNSSKENESKEGDGKEKTKLPERRKPEKEGASANSQPDAKPKRSRSSNRSPGRDSNDAGPSTADAKRKEAPKVDGSRSTPNTSTSSSRRLSERTLAQLKRDLQMTPRVPPVSSSASQKPSSSKKREPQRDRDAGAKPRRRGHGEESEDEGHKSGSESTKRNERRRGENP
ncbi:hypothetical protein ACMFMG_005866 [Clarireedia jacksonii]